MYYGPRIKDFTHEDMRNACKKDLINPLYFFDEQFVRISDYIPELADYYCISNYGRLFSCITGRISATHDNKGYEGITLKCKDHTYKTFTIHRLVIRCFKPIPNYEEMAVNHIDGNKYNNHISNLEWVTDSENMIHCYRNNLEVNGEDHPWAVISEVQAHQICKMIEQGMCNRDIAISMFNDVNKVHLIASIRSGKSWKNVSQNYILPQKANIDHVRRFTNDELMMMYEYATSGMNTKEVAIACGINIDEYDDRGRENIYKIIRAVRDKKAYKHLFNE